MLFSATAQGATELLDNYAAVLTVKVVRGTLDTSIFPGGQGRAEGRGHRAAMGRFHTTRCQRAYMALSRNFTLTEPPCNN